MPTLIQPMISTQLLIAWYQVEVCRVKIIWWEGLDSNKHNSKSSRSSQWQDKCRILVWRIKEDLECSQECNPIWWVAKELWVKELWDKELWAMEPWAALVRWILLADSSSSKNNSSQTHSVINSKCRIRIWVWEVSIRTMLQLAFSLHKCHLTRLSHSLNNQASEVNQLDLVANNKRLHRLILSATSNKQIKTLKEMFSRAD
jgi:hypothetical protein